MAGTNRGVSKDAFPAPAGLRLSLREAADPVAVSATPGPDQSARSIAPAMDGPRLERTKLSLRL